MEHKLYLLVFHGLLCTCALPLNGVLNMSLQYPDLVLGPDGLDVPLVGVEKWTGPLDLVVDVHSKQGVNMVIYIIPTHLLSLVRQVHLFFLNFFLILQLSCKTNCGEGEACLRSSNFYLNEYGLPVNRTGEIKDKLHLRYLEYHLVVLPNSSSSHPVSFSISLTGSYCSGYGYPIFGMCADIRSILAPGFIVAFYIDVDLAQVLNVWLYVGMEALLIFSAGEATLNFYAAWEKMPTNTSYDLKFLNISTPSKLKLPVLNSLRF